MPSFFGWLCQQVDRPDPVGLLARTARKDKLFPNHTKRLYLLLLRFDGVGQVHGVDAAVLRRAVKKAHREWRQVRREQRA